MDKGDYLHQSQWTHTVPLRVVSAELKHEVLRAFGGPWCSYSVTHLLDRLLDLIGRRNLDGVVWTADTYFRPAYMRGQWPSGVFSFPVLDRFPSYLPSWKYKQEVMELGRPTFVADLGRGSAPTPDFFGTHNASSSDPNP